MENPLIVPATNLKFEHLPLIECSKRGEGEALSPFLTP